MRQRLLLMLKLAGIGACLLLPLLGQAQEAPTVPPVKTAYFDQQDNKLPSEAGASRRVETTYRDSVAGVVREYYLPSGKLKAYTPYANVRRRLRHGTSSQYYEDGKLRVQATYVAGKVVGDFVTYYPDGTLKRRDHYLPNQPVAGECFGPDGQPVPYFPYEVMPVYSQGAGDIQAIVRAVMRNVRYPKEALRQRITGVVKIAFTVDKDGRVQHVRPDERVKTAAMSPAMTEAYHQLQEAAMQAVRQLKPFTPGRQDGENVPIAFTVPVTFSIQ